MKKFFFFRSSANGKSNLGSSSSSSDDRQAYWENPLESSANSSKHNSSSPKLRRTRSLSSAAFYGLNDSSDSPGNDINSSKRQHEHPSRCRSPTPERQYDVKQMEMLNDHYKSGSERPRSSASSRAHLDSSGISSNRSSNVSNRVLDRYIDGEQQQEISAAKNNYSQRKNGWRPPRAHCVAPSSPTASIKDKPIFHSFREAKSSLFRSSSGEWGEGEFANKSPRSLARDVVDRLSQCHVAPNATSKELDHGLPITTTDIYSNSLKRCLDPSSDVVTQTCFPTDELGLAVNGCHSEEFSSFQKQKKFPVHAYEECKSGETDEELDGELQRSAKEAEERILILSEELEQEPFVQYRKFEVSDLIQIIRDLTEERYTLALEISSLLQSRIAERASAKKELRLANAELDSTTRKLEKEKNELQIGLEKELDRRSSDWSFKLEKYQLEENSLRERVRELAELNVSLHREVSSLNVRETENRSTITHLEQNLLDLTSRFEENSEQNKYLQLNLSKIEENCRAATEARDCIKKNLEEKENECRELHESITRYLRTCSEQEKTIDGLRERFSEELGKKQSVEKFDKQVEKLKMEQMRLTGVELALRKELESYRVEVESLRHENIQILTRLKVNGKDSGAVTLKLDNEMCTRIYHLQNQGLVLLNESSQFCYKLLEFIKEKVVLLQETNRGREYAKNGLDGQFFVESEMKVQSFKHGIESLTRSLQKISMLLHEKSNPACLNIHSQSSDVDRAVQLNNQYSEDVLRSELKAETLLTSLLREKLYSKELEVEQLQAEVGAAVRGNDMLKCEVQNGMNNLSCLTHKLKDLELQLLKKNEDISKIQNSLEECTEELETRRDTLLKVSKERDVMWEEVNKYREKNMLLNSEMDVLKRKIETLDEELLLKEGQITILKDTIGSKSIDLLSSPGSTWEFRH